MEWLHQGCDGDLPADFLNFGAGDFPLKIPFSCASKSFFLLWRFGAEIRIWSCNFWRRSAKKILCESLLCVKVPVCKNLLCVKTYCVYELAMCKSFSV